LTINAKDAREYLNFSALLCSRLCHDLISPVGAMGNGIEILRDEDDPEMREQVISLLEDSARQTSNRLQFFRLAFGAAGGFGDKVDAREAQKASASLFSQGKTKLVWEADATTLPKELVKLLLNLLLIGHEALIRGGTISVHMAFDGEDKLLAKIVGEGERYILGEGAQKALRNELSPKEVEPRSAPAQLANLIALGSDAQIYLDATNPQSFTLGFSADLSDS
jgi:histidine phosphotransferase ChpT